MDSETLNKQLQRYGLTLNAACKHILIYTQAAITPDDVRKHLVRHGRLSAHMQAAFGMLFELQSQRKERHGRAA